MSLNWAFFVCETHLLKGNVLCRQDYRNESPFFAVLKLLGACWSHEFMNESLLFSKMRFHFPFLLRHLALQPGLEPADISCCKGLYDGQKHFS